jgi:hypothetical protein
VIRADAYALNHHNFPQYRAARFTHFQDNRQLQFNTSCNYSGQSSLSGAAEVFFDCVSLCSESFRRVVEGVAE